MADAHRFYDSGKLALMGGNASWANDSITAILLDQNYAFDPQDDTYGDVSPLEASSPDYQQVEVPGRSVTLDDEGRVVFTSEDISFGDDVSIAARSVVFVVGTPGNLGSNDTLISAHDLGRLRESENSEFKLIAPDFWLRITLEE